MQPPRIWKRNSLHNRHISKSTSSYNPSVTYPFAQISMSILSLCTWTKADASPKRIWHHILAVHQRCQHRAPPKIVRPAITSIRVIIIIQRRSVAVILSKPNPIFFDQLMGKKGKNFRRDQQDDEPKKKHVITEQQLMDKSHMDRTEFTPITTADSLYPPFIYEKQTEIVLRKVLIDLNYLLYLDFKHFWATLLYSPSLKHCLSSCLSYLHRRWLNDYVAPGEQADIQLDFNYKRVKDGPIYEYTEGIAKVLLTLYYRVMNFNAENKELSQLYKINEAISGKFIFDFPKLLELLQIYGESNPAICKAIVRMYSHTQPNIYNTLTQTILPILFKRINDLLPSVKQLSQRQQFGLQYSYKRAAGRDLSPGQQQLKRKTSILMQMISFITTIKNIMTYFPQECADHCFFNSNIHFLYQNIFLELQVAYKCWNYQNMQGRFLPYINWVVFNVLQYFKSFFRRCNEILVERTLKKNTVGAYVRSLQRIFKDYGKRFTQGKKGANKHHMLMYKIIQKEVDICSMVDQIYSDQIENGTFQINTHYLADFIVDLQKMMKEGQEIKCDVMPVQQQLQDGDDTQADQQQKMEQNDQYEIIEGPQHPHYIKDAEDLKIIRKMSEDKALVDAKLDLNQMERVVSKRQRTDDYYANLYAGYQNLCKREYDDEYDDLMDYDKKPLFIDEESSVSESDEENEKHLVGNKDNLEKTQALHTLIRINSNQRKEQQKRQQENKMKSQKQGRPPIQYNAYRQPREQYSDEQESYQPKKYAEKPKGQTTQDKPKYVAKTQQISLPPGPIQQINNNPKEQLQQQQEAPSQQTGSGWKKNNKSYNYVKRPEKKDHNFDKGRNSNKERQDNGRKKYKEKY